MDRQRTTAGGGFVENLERQSIGRSQNSPQAVLDYLLRKKRRTLASDFESRIKSHCNAYILLGGNTKIENDIHTHKKYCKTFFQHFYLHKLDLIR